MGKLARLTQRGECARLIEEVSHDDADHCGSIARSIDRNKVRSIVSNNIVVVLLLQYHCC